MSTEEKIFNKCVFDFDKLLSFGFKLKDNFYYYNKYILNDSFKIEIIINEKQNVIGKIIEVDFDEEYTNYKIEPTIGEFANKIKKEYEQILLSIKEKCCQKLFFQFNQANTITNYIINKYNEFPTFPWKKYDGYGVFKHKENGKWYGIVMNINKSKIDKNYNEEIEILNVKVKKEDLAFLLLKKGIYKAYHMNKNSWISIILDNTLSDEDIFPFIDQSYMLSR